MLNDREKNHGNGISSESQQNFTTKILHIIGGFQWIKIRERIDDIGSKHQILSAPYYVLFHMTYIIKLRKINDNIKSKKFQLYHS